MKKAFSLVELLVVIGIIAVLAGVLVASLGGSTDSARAAHCLSNMKNLANACQTALMRDGYYPLASSFEYVSLEARNNGVKSTYNERKGWIGWNSDGAYRNGPTSKKASSSWFVSAYSTEGDADAIETARNCITNGSTASALSFNTQLYVCPDHIKAAKSEGLVPNWSYVMNGYFKWDSSRGSKYKSDKFVGRYRDNVTRPDRVLLLAELPFKGDLVDFTMSSSSSTDNDAVLQYAKPGTVKSKGVTGSPGESEYGNETIGFNHKTAKRWCAHVAFADGHCEKLLAPKDGSGNLRELTSWLCEGVDFSFDGKNYRKLDD